MFIAYEVATQLVHALGPVLSSIARHDKDLVSQLRRAGSSVLFNIAEGNRRTKGDRLHHFRVAAGSAAEVRAALTVAVAWSYVPAAAVAEPLALLDRQLRLLWGLTHKAA